jgi:hypothetical protein
MSDDPNQEQSGQRQPEYGQPSDQPGQPSEQYPPQSASTPPPIPPAQPDPNAPPDYGQQPYPPPGAPGPNPYLAPPAYPGQGYQDYQGYQGYPPPGVPYESYAPPGSQAFNLQTLIQRWQNVLTRPSVPTFDAEQPAANWQTILISLLILGVVGAVSQFIIGLEPSSAMTINLPNQPPYRFHPNPVGSAFGGLIGVFVGFFVLSGILYVSAKVFNGQGTFLTQSWLLSLFLVPLSIISAVAGIIPYFGSLVAFAVFIYSVYLAVLAIASAHRLSQGRAVAVVLLPLAILFVLACVFALPLAALITSILRVVGY